MDNICLNCKHYCEDEYLDEETLEESFFGYCKTGHITYGYDTKACDDFEELKGENKLTCDRNICLKNEYNNIGCEDCVVTRGDNK